MNPSANISPSPFWTLNKVIDLSPCKATAIRSPYLVAETGIFSPSRLSRISPVSGLIIFTWLSNQLDNIT